MQTCEKDGGEKYVDNETMLMLVESGYDIEHFVPGLGDYVEDGCLFKRGKR